MYRQHTPGHSRARRRGLEVALLVGAFAFILNGLLGSARTRRDRQQQRQALQTWEGEGGAAKQPDGAGLH
jgi:hypothetical protein